MNKSKKKYQVEGYGLVALALLFLAWCMTTISYKSNIFWFLGGALLIFAQIIYIWLCKCIEDDTLIAQLKGLNRCSVLVGMIIVATCYRYDSGELVVVSIFLGISIIITTVLAQKNINESILVTKEEWIHFLNKVREHETLLLLLSIFCVLAFDKSGPQFKWDGLLYYEAAHDINLYSISSLAQYGHISQMYSVILKVAILLLGRVDIAMESVNIAMMLLSICGFYKLLKLIVNGKDELSYILGTAVYGCSPFVLGMVNYFSLDYYLICLLPWCMYKGLRKQWCDFFVISVLFCFTKETAIVIYALLCAGLLILDFIDIEGTLKVRVKKIISYSYYYYMFFIGVCWIVIYKILGPWSAGAGGFGIKTNYIVAKLKVLGLLNFNWLLLLIALWGLIHIVTKNKIGTGILWWIPTLSIAIGFSLFSILFVTINHARYIDSGVFVLNICAVVVLLNINGNKISKTLMAGLALLMLLSCYFTIDPVSKHVFQTIDIGNTKMITTSAAGFGDSMIYNKQMLYMENAISEVVLRAYENDYDVATPVVGNSTYNFDGMQEVMVLKEGYSKRILYCEQDGSRDVYQSEGSKNVNFYAFTNNLDYEEVLSYSGKPIIFIYTDMFGIDVYENIKKYCKVLDESTIYKKGYKIRTIVFE